MLNTYEQCAKWGTNGAGGMVSAHKGPRGGIWTFIQVSQLLRVISVYKNGKCLGVIFFPFENLVFVIKFEKIPKKLWIKIHLRCK